MITLNKNSFMKDMISPVDFPLHIKPKYSTVDENSQNQYIDPDDPEFTKAFLDYEDDTNIDLKLLDIGYKLLKLIRMDMYSIRWGRGKQLWLFITVLRFSMIGLIFQMVANNYGDIIYVVNCIKSISAFFQGFAKVIPLVLNPEYMIYIRLATIKHFWRTSCKGPESENYNLFTKIMLSYQYSIYIMFFFLVLKTLVTKTLMFEVYTPDIPLVFPVFLLLQYFEFLIDMIFVIGMDLIFLSSCVLIWRQSKLLFNEFSNIDGNKGFEATMRDFGRCVKQHHFLLDYVNCVTEAFKIPLLFQYGISILGMCIDLYILSENPPIVEFLSSVTYLLMLSCQVGLYCFIADKTSEMVEMIGVFINNTKWYDNPVYLNKMLTLVICRSQKNVRFSAGGMGDINKEAFTEIFKTTMSFFMLVRQLKEN